MMGEPGPPISDAERRILQTLWDAGPSSVRDVHLHLRGAGGSWARSTVVTLLQRLERKGYVASDKSGHAFLFRAALSREELVGQRLSELADDLCDGQWSPLLLAFAERSQLKPGEAEKLQELIDQLSNQPSSKRKKPS